MNNFIFSINSTIPLFLVIFLGYMLKRLKIINDEFVNVANKYVFIVALPVMLFKDLAFSGIMKNVKGTFIIYCIVVTILMFMVTWLLAYIFLKDKSIVGAFTQASVRSSAALLGIAFVENICGESGMAPLMIASAVPFFNILSVIILIFSANFGKKDKEKVRLKEEIRKSVRGILTNPIIIGIVVGILWSMSGLKMPVIPNRTIDIISGSATPMALIAIGGGFDFDLAITKIKPSIVASIIKLMILPMVFLPTAILMHFNSTEMVAILIMLSSPTTVSCYVMAKAMDNDEVLTSNVVVLTTIFSSITLTLWVFILRSMGLI